MVTFNIKEYCCRVQNCLVITITIFKTTYSALSLQQFGLLANEERAPGLLEIFKLFYRITHGGGARRNGLVNKWLFTTVIEFLLKVSEHLDFFDELRLLLLATYERISRIWGINEFSFKVDEMVCELQRENQCGRIWLQKSDLL